MPSKRKPKTLRLELYISWMLGALVLLISNSTIFRRFDASIGDPWLNLLLGAAVLALLVRIGAAFFQLQREVLASNARIDRVDGLGELEFAAYMQEAYARQGWQCAGGPERLEGGFGLAFIQLEEGARRVAAVCQPGRRKLTKEYVSTVHEALSASSDRERWIVTNATFTPQAAKAAARLGVRLVDRKALIRLLAQVGTVHVSNETSVLQD